MGIDKELANDIMLAMVTLELGGASMSVIEIFQQLRFGGASRRAIYKLRTALQ
jgi:hypothetical protein